MFCGFCRPGTPPTSDAGNPCRGGFHIRPGCWRRRKAGRYGIGPYSGAGGLRPSGGVYGRAGLRDDASIVLYTGLRCRKIAVSRLAAGPVRFAGNGLDRSAGPCAAATGPIGNRPLRRRGRFAARRRRARRGGVRGGMRASRPTDVLQVSHQPGMHPLLTRDPPVGADSISARGVGGGANRADMESAPTAVREGVRPCGGVYGGAGARQMRHCCIPHKEIYARRRKLRAYILRDIGRGARFSAARLCG